MISQPLLEMIKSLDPDSGEPLAKVNPYNCRAFYKRITTDGTTWYEFDLASFVKTYYDLNEEIFHGDVTVWNLNDPVVTESHQLAKDLLDDLAVLTPSTKATAKPNKLDLAYRIVHNQQELAKNQARLAKTLAQADSIERFSPQQIKAKAAELTAELAARGVIRLIESDHVARKSAALEELIQLGSKLDRSSLDLWSIYGFEPVDFTDQTARQSLGLPEVITPEMMTEVDARLKTASENTPKTSSKPSLTLFEAVSRDLVKPMPASLLKSLAVSWYNQDLIQDLVDDIDQLVTLIQTRLGSIDIKSKLCWMAIEIGYKIGRSEYSLVIQTSDY